MKRRIYQITIIICLLLLTGCTAQKAQPSEDVLWVLTEQSPSDGMNYQAEQIAKAFEKEHSGLTVRIEILPTDAEERSLYLSQLRTQIMAGNGPDVYLLPTGSILQEEVPTGSSTVFTTHAVEIEPLFPDVPQAMYNGVFADIQTNYASDTDLYTDGLNQPIMDAGVVNGCRYVLPLRYDIPVLLADPAAASFAFSGKVTAGELTEHIVSGGKPENAFGLQLSEDFTMLPSLFDYASGEVRITQAEIEAYLSDYQRLCAMRREPLKHFLENWIDEIFEGVPEELAQVSKRGHSYGLEDFCSVTSFICFGSYWADHGFALFTGGLSAALENAAVAQYQERELICAPICTSRGTVAADVTYYGAVGASCRKPELAYAYLREFLTEDWQWDLLRPQTDYSKSTSGRTPKEVQIRGLIENSWPVRSNGSAQPMWQTVRYQVQRYGNGFRQNANAVKRKFLSTVALTDEALPILRVPIDEVRFPVWLPDSLKSVLSQLNDDDGTPTDADIPHLAAEVYSSLWWHLAEG